MILPVSDHVRSPRQDGVPEDPPRPQDVLRGDLLTINAVKSMPASRAPAARPGTSLRAEGEEMSLPLKCI